MVLCFRKQKTKTQNRREVSAKTIRDEYEASTNGRLTTADVLLGDELELLSEAELSVGTNMVVSP